MGKRLFKLKPNTRIKHCPSCRQNTVFHARSEQVAEDMCEVWVVCICGHDPHESGDRLEDVWGALDEGTITDALECWNDAVSRKLSPKE